MSHATSISSGLLISDQAVVVGRGMLNAVMINTNGTNNATVVIYDNTSGPTGNIIFAATVPGAQLRELFTFNIPVRCNTGMYCDVSGTGASYIIYHSGC